LLTFRPAGRAEGATGGTLANLSTVRAYDTSLRPQTAQIKNGANILQEVAYAYDTAGRLQTVTDASATAYTATYGYPTNSPLIDTVIFKQNSTNRLVTTRTYDRLNRLTSIRSTAYGTGALALPVVFDYTYNPANQRTRMNLADGAYWVYQYDVLGQVISGRNQTAGAGRSRPTSSSFTIWPGRRGAGT
jgi:YD repeat-containing protein